MADLERALSSVQGQGDRALVITDGVFSMRGDHAPLRELMAICHRHDAEFSENVIVLVDDSHGVGAFGATGRGTEEYTGAPPCESWSARWQAFGVPAAADLGAADPLPREARRSAFISPVTPRR
jgi:glycine C-acetyltransferase